MIDTRKWQRPAVQWRADAGRCGGQRLCTARDGASLRVQCDRGADGRARLSDAVAGRPSSQPVVSTLNAIDGAITSNMAIVPNINGKIDAYASGITQLMLDISSYFAP